MSKIYVYPALTDPIHLSNIVCRLAWYFKPYIGKIDEICFTSTKARLSVAGLAPKLDPLVEGDLDAIKAKIRLLDHKGFAAQIATIDAENDILLIWDETSEKSAPESVRDAIKKLSSKRGFYRVDPLRTRMEGSFYLWAGLNKYADQAAWTAQNHERMRALVAEIGQHEKAYVFGSGPSLSEFVDTHDFSDGICVISNSIVKNREIIARTRPRIIAAADPLYHAGCSSYAGAFRSELIHALRETGAWFVCPMRDFAIYDTFLPTDLRSRIIGIPFNKEGTAPVNLAESFYLKPYPNVLTLALLPLAATIARKIEIIGCDGRELTDDSFFWSHDAKAQFNDKMAEIQAAHPAFFAINYNDYYIDHCRDVEEVLDTLEKSGKHLVTSTASMIPALHHREPAVVAQTEPAPGKIAAFAMIDPDAKDDWGHFLAYDKRVAEGCHDLNTDFVLLCRKELDPKFFPDSADLVIPTFSVHSWVVGKDWPNTRRHEVMIFAKELDEAFATLEEQYPVGEICVFMYIGSIEAAEVIEHLLMLRPRIRAVIDLFWSYNFDETDPAYRATWEKGLRRLSRSQQVRLLHATPQISADYRSKWGVDLPVLPHPSTTFGDTDAAALAKLPKARPNAPIKVLFPGGARKEKGFVLSVGACAELSGSSDFTCALRARIDRVSGQELAEALASLRVSKGDTVEILDADLSDEQFVDMIRTADIIVIPYLSEAFRRRTSGILVDAILLGKPVVVLKGTWLGDIVEAGGIGVCADPDPISLAAAVREVAVRYSTFLDKIDSVRRNYLATHTWNELVRKVVERAGLTLPAPRKALTKAEQDAKQKELKALIAKLPTRAPIYLPTEKIALADQIKGLTRVKKIYDTGLKDVYGPRMQALREKYRGTKRCFVIGNGPSLNKTDLSLLKDEVTFAVNGFFLKTAELDWKPTFYVVEDHLVAEDRAKWINAFKGPIKLFPAYLGYMFPEAPDTIFYNHRPRKSYPHGFDFSKRADEITYTGCTVTFSMLQLAYYLGFEEIYMIGVDADYAIPTDAKEGSAYSVGVIDMDSDDTNHFHPDYFGKGFRWHDPQVEKMVEAYQEARKVVDETNQRIYNATIGGQLEVFERRDYASLFAKPEALTPADYPRVLVLDLTAIGDGTATGEIKHNLLADWPADRLLQVALKGPDGLMLTRGRINNVASTWATFEAEANAIIDVFDPEVIVYRPVPNTAVLHDFAMKVIERLNRPLVTWLMDDWPQHLKSTDPEQFEWIDKDLHQLLERSELRLSICHAMSEAMLERYKKPFFSLANGVDAADWPAPKIHVGGQLLLRYAGGLAENMTRASLLRICKMVEKLGNSGCDVRFEINTRRFFYQPNLKEFGGFRHTAFTCEPLPTEEYKKWLSEADVTVIAYNFDPETARYAQYSMANKMPECLASGAVVFAHGPAGFATIDYLAALEGAVVVTTNADKAVEDALRALQEDPARRNAIVAKARATAFSRHNVFKLREDLRRLLVRAANAAQPSAPRPMPASGLPEHIPALATGVLKLASRLLLSPSETLSQIEQDPLTRKLVDEAQTSGEIDSELRAHFQKCFAYAQKTSKVLQ